MSGLPNNDNKKVRDRELLVSKSKRLARDAASINGADGGCCVAIAMPGEGERELKLKLNSAAIFMENPQVNCLLQDISAGGKIVFVSICMNDEYTWPSKGFFQFLLQNSEALIYPAQACVFFDIPKIYHRHFSISLPELVEAMQLAEILETLELPYPTGEFGK